MIVRRLARPMLATAFVVGGIEALRNPKSRVEDAKPVVEAMSDSLGTPNDPELMVRGTGAAVLAGGALLALGKTPRLASALLATVLAPTMATHNFWAESDSSAKAAKQRSFVTNVSLLGGLVLAAIDTEGKPGVTYRAKMAGDSVGRSARGLRRSAKREAKLAAAQAKNALS